MEVRRCIDVFGKLADLYENFPHYFIVLKYITSLGASRDVFKLEVVYKNIFSWQIVTASYNTFVGCFKLYCAHCPSLCALSLLLYSPLLVAWPIIALYVAAYSPLPYLLDSLVSY